MLNRAAAGMSRSTMPKASSLLSASGPLAPLLVRAEVRPSQLAMADAVEEAMGTPGARLVVEAGVAQGSFLPQIPESP